MGTAAIVVCIYLVVTAVVTFLLFLMDKASVKEWAGSGFGEDYYELKNHSYGSPCWEGGGHIGDGCIKLIFLPFFWFFQSVSRLRYALANLKYYLLGGREKRIVCIKNFIEREYKEYQKHVDGVKKYCEIAGQEFIGVQDWTLRGKTREWKLQEILKSDFKDFTEDNLLMPFGFWLRSIISFLVLLFWPLTIITIYGSLGLLLCLAVMSHILGWPKFSDGSCLRKLFTKIMAE